MSSSLPPLAEQTCDARSSDAVRVAGSEAQQLLSQLDRWQIIQYDGIDQLSKQYVFANFVDALAFTQRVGALAERFDHHPALLTEWGQVTVRWWTHDLSGLHKNDFILAAKTDML